MRTLKAWWIQITLAIIIVLLGLTLIIRIQYDTGQTRVSQNVYTISSIIQNDDSITVSLRNGTKYVLDNYRISYETESSVNKLIKYTNKFGSFSLDDTYELVLNKM